MTEFTSDEVKRLRKSLEFSHGTYCEKYLERALDHIERLQKRVNELEQERRWIHQDKTMIIKKDGDSWCAVLPDFENLQQSESRWFSGDVNKYMDDVYGFLNPLPNPPKDGE